MNQCLRVAQVGAPWGRLVYMPIVVTSGVLRVQNTLGCVIVRRGASRLSGLITADWEQKFRTKPCMDEGWIADLFGQRPAGLCRAAMLLSPMSASLIGRSGSSTFRLSITAVSMS